MPSFQSWVLVLRCAGKVRLVMSERESQPNRAQELLKKLSDDELKEFMEAQITEEQLGDELARRIGAQGLSFMWSWGEEDGYQIHYIPKDKK